MIFLKRANGSNRNGRIKNSRSIRSFPFNSEETISHIKKDTDGDGFFDTHYAFENGILKFSQKDSDANGTFNVKTDYKNQLPVLQLEDSNEDGITEKRIEFDASGKIKKNVQRPFW